MKSKKTINLIRKRIALILVMVLAFTQSSFAQYFGLMIVASAQEYADIGFDLEYDGINRMVFSPIVNRPVYFEDQENEADPTGTVDYAYYVIQDEEELFLEDPESGAVWTSISAGNSIIEDYSWTVPEELKDCYVRFRMTYSGDDVFYQDYSYDVFAFIPPVIESVSDVVLSEDEYVFSVDLSLNSMMWECLYCNCVLSSVDENGAYDEVVSTDIVKEPTACVQIDGIEPADPVAEIRVNGDEFAEGNYVFQIVVTDIWGNISNRVVTKPFTVGEVYSSNDISVSIAESLYFTGEEQTPDVMMNGKGENSDVVSSWINRAVSDNKISYSFIQLKDGDGAIVNDTTLKSTVKDAGTYAIYATSSDLKVRIKGEPLGEFVVEKGNIMPDLSPVLTVCVSTNKTGYVVSMNTTGITNNCGLPFEYSFNGGDYSNINELFTGADEVVSGSVRFAATVNTYESAVVSADSITTPERTKSPMIDSGTHSSKSFSVVITAYESSNAISSYESSNKSTDTVVSDNAAVYESANTIYYTTDGSEPDIYHYTGTGAGIVEFDIKTTTVVKAVAVADGKMISEIKTANFVISDNTETGTDTGNGGNTTGGGGTAGSGGGNGSGGGGSGTASGGTKTEDGVRHIESVMIEDWGDINWVENTGTPNKVVFNGRIMPADATEKLTISVVDTLVSGNVISSVSSNRSDDIIKNVVVSETDKDGRFTITVEGSETLYTGGYATIHLGTDKGRNKAVAGFKDVLTTVKYLDVTGVSVNTIKTNESDDAVYRTIEVSGLNPGAMYHVEVSGNKVVKPWKDCFVADSNGMISDPQFKNVDFTINRTNDKLELYYDDPVKYAAWEAYIDLVGAGQSFTTEETKFEKSTGLFYVIENEDDIVFTGAKITPVVHIYEGDRELVEGQDFTVSYKNNLNAGDAKAIVKGKNGSNVEKTELIFKIQQADIADADIVTVQSVKGKAGAQPVVVYNGIKMGQKKTYNKISKDLLKNSNTEEMTTVEIQGIGNFTGTSVFNVRGVAKKVSIKAKLNTKKFAYAGHNNFNAEDVINAVTVTKGNKESAKVSLPKKDPAFVMGNAGSYKLAVMGTDELEGTVKFLKFSITPVKNASFKLNVNAVDYDPRGVTFDESEYSLTGVGDEKLIRGMDYTMSYSKNKKAGTAKVTVTFKGSYKGTKKATATFAINKADIATAIEDSFAAPAVNEKKAKKNTVYLVDNDILLKKGKKADYTTTYNGISDGVATIMVNGAGNYTGSVAITFDVKDCVDDFTKAKVKAGKGQKFNYNGSEFTNDAGESNKVDVSVTKVTSETMQYHFFNNINKGKAVVVVCGDGENSTGSKAAKFTIKGAKTINRRK